MNQLIRILAATMLIALAPVTQASLYQVDNLLTGGGGWNASVLHTSPDPASPASGSVFATFNGAVGSFNGTAAGGSLNISFTIAGGGTASLAGNGFAFAGSGLQSNNVTATLTLDQITNGYAAGAYSILFSSGLQCGTCGDPNSPNSLMPGSGSNLILSLWGATTNTTGQRVGMDIQVDLGPTGNDVPIPAAAWLFGSALAGLVGIRKRQARTTKTV